MKNVYKEVSEIIMSHIEVHKNITSKEVEKLFNKKFRKLKITVSDSTIRLVLLDYVSCGILNRRMDGTIALYTAVESMFDKNSPDELRKIVQKASTKRLSGWKEARKPQPLDKETLDDGLRPDFITKKKTNKEQQHTIEIHDKEEEVLMKEGSSITSRVLSECLNVFGEFVLETKLFKITVTR